jgi:hypothetical protein
MPTVEGERVRREAMWARLQAAGDPSRLPPQLLRELSIYGGAQGIWVDTERTRGIDGGGGITVSLLHTGRHYADELSTDGVLYHYPRTGRPPGRDRSEVEATKAAGRLRLPVSCRGGWTWPASSAVPSSRPDNALPPRSCHPDHHPDGREALQANPEEAGQQPVTSSVSDPTRHCRPIRRTVRGR